MAFFSFKKQITVLAQPFKGLNVQNIEVLKPGETIALRSSDESIAITTNTETGEIDIKAAGLPPSTVAEWAAKNW